MGNLTKFTVSFDKDKKDWKLTNDKTDRTIKRFNTKENALKGGILKKLVGRSGGSVKIQKKSPTTFQEERTYPKSKDPKSSKG
ncbi:MAG: DUF2188 domain-containing protein [Patescibacteria group bacterium]|nr:DUF2188 domain-containing protein [Patescibacteria group bacterium]